MEFLMFITNYYYYYYFISHVSFKCANIAHCLPHKHFLLVS